MTAVAGRARGALTSTMATRISAFLILQRSYEIQWMHRLQDWRQQFGSGLRAKPRLAERQQLRRESVSEARTARPRLTNHDPQADGVPHEASDTIDQIVRSGLDEAVAARHTAATHVPALILGSAGHEFAKSSPPARQVALDLIAHVQNRLHLGCRVAFLDPLYADDELSARYSCAKISLNFGMDRARPDQRGKEGSSNVWHGVHQPLSNSDSSFFFTTMSTRWPFSSNIHVAEVSTISGSGTSKVSVKGLVRYWPKLTRIVFTSLWESLGVGTSSTSIADALSGEVNFLFRRATTFANGSPKGVNSSSFSRIAARCPLGSMADFSSSPWASWTKTIRRSNASAK